MPRPSASSSAVALSSWRASKTPSRIAVVSARPAIGPEKPSTIGSGSAAALTRRRLRDWLSGAVGLDLAAVPDRLLLLGPVGDHAVAPVALGAVEGGVGRAEQRLGTHPRSRRRRNAERNRQVQPTGPRFSDRLAQSRRHLRATGHVPSGQEDYELLAAEPVDELERAEGLAHLIGTVAEDGVAAVMTVGVVHGLEAVEVGKDGADRAAGQDGL